MHSDRLTTSLKRRTACFCSAICLFLFVFINLFTFPFMVKAQEKKDDKERLATVSGCLKVNGKPTSGVNLALHLSDYSSNEKAVALATTDENGCYQMSNLPANHYQLKVLAPEYLNADEKAYYRIERSVSLTPGASLNDVNLDLVSGGVISGRITDINGKPVANEYLSLTHVWEYQAKTHFPTPSDTTQCKSDADGNYKITGIRPGRYLVSIGEDIERVNGSVHYKNDWGAAQGRVGKAFYYAQTFYPGVTSKTDARIIEVSVGTELEGTDIVVGELKKSYTASGRAIEAATGKPLSNYDLQVTHKYGGGYIGTTGGGKTDDEGYFRLTGLIESKFSVSVYFKDDTPLFTKALDFEIKDNDVDGLELIARKGLSISGSVQIEDSDKSTSSKLSDLKLHIKYLRGEKSSEAMFRQTPVKSDHSFTINGLFTGQIELSVWSSYFDLQRVEYLTPQGNVELFPADRSDMVTVPLKDVDLKDLRLVVAYKGGSIKGQVKIIGGKLGSGTVLNVGIQKKTGRGFWSTSRVVDVNGNFSIDGLEAGAYELDISHPNDHFRSERQIAKVAKNTEVNVTFVIDVGKRKGETK